MNEDPQGGCCGCFLWLFVAVALYLVAQWAMSGGLT
jgi:hypothetical protein